MVAVKDLWIIGDDYINEIYHAFPALNAEAKKSKAEGKDAKPPYCFSFYNVHCFTSNPASTTTTASVPARLVNCLIKALNKNNYLPCFVIVIPDWDLLKFFNHTSFRITEITSTVTRWMMTKMQRAIDTKRDAFVKVKTGSVSPREPKIIWVKMIKRLRGYSKILAVRNKFNHAIEKLLAK